MRSASLGTVVGTLLLLAGCHAEARPASTAATAIVAPPPRDAPSSAVPSAPIESVARNDERPALAGFELGVPFDEVVRRCPGFAMGSRSWTARCTGPAEPMPQRVASVTLRLGRDEELSAISVRFQLDDVAELHDLLRRSLPEWWSAYGEPSHPMLESVSPSCAAEFARGEPACLYADGGSGWLEWSLRSSFVDEGGARLSFGVVDGHANAELTLATLAGLDAQHDDS